MKDLETAPSEYHILSVPKQNLGFHKIKRRLSGGNKCDTLAGHKTRIDITTEQKTSSHDIVAYVVARAMLKSSRITLQLNSNSSCSVGQDSVVS